MRETNNFHRVIVTCLTVALLLMQTLAHAESQTIERIEWKKVPIRLELVVGQEQRIEFPNAVKVGIPASVQPRLRTQSVNGTVYLLAHAPFDTNRIMVRELDSGRIYLLDVTSTQDGAVTHPVQIYVTDDSGAYGLEINDSSPERPSYIQLTRFAAQQLYAPSRLFNDNPVITRVLISRNPVDLLHGGAVEAIPLVAWRANGLYITAVKLTNRTHQARTLDPRDLRGAWLTASFQHHRLLPMGDEADTTAVYLISARPFEISHQE